MKKSIKLHSKDKVCTLEKCRCYKRYIFSYHRIGKLVKPIRLSKKKMEELHKNYLLRLRRIERRRKKHDEQSDWFFRVRA